jgi:hypothetical protein
MQYNLYLLSVIASGFSLMWARDAYVISNGNYQSLLNQDTDLFLLFIIAIIIWSLDRFLAIILFKLYHIDLIDLFFFTPTRVLILAVCLSSNRLSWIVAALYSIITFTFTLFANYFAKILYQSKFIRRLSVLFHRKKSTLIFAIIYAFCTIVIIIFAFKSNFSFDKLILSSLQNDEAGSLYAFRDEFKQTTGILSRIHVYLSCFFTFFANPTLALNSVQISSKSIRPQEKILIIGLIVLTGICAFTSTTVKGFLVINLVVALAIAFDYIYKEVYYKSWQKTLVLTVLFLVLSASLLTDLGRSLYFNVIRRLFLTQPYLQTVALINHEKLIDLDPTLLQEMISRLSKSTFIGQSGNAPTGFLLLPYLSKQFLLTLPVAIILSLLYQATLRLIVMVKKISFWDCMILIPFLYAFSSSNPLTLFVTYSGAFFVCFSAPLLIASHVKIYPLPKAFR